MIFSNTVKNITKEKILPSIVDSVNNSNILTARIAMKSVKTWSGRVVAQPVRVANSRSGGSVAGMEEFSTEGTDNVRSLTWYPKTYAQSVVVPKIEEAVNAGADSQAVKLIAAKLDEARASLTQAVGSQFYGYGVGEAFDGLGLITDNGTATDEYAGLRRADFPVINGTVVSPAGGNLTIDVLAQTLNGIGAAGSSVEAPTIGLMDQVQWSLLEKIFLRTGALQAHYTATGSYGRVTAGSDNGTTVSPIEVGGALGVKAIDYRGIPMVADDKAPSGKLFFVNENYLEFHSLKMPGLEQIKANAEVEEGAGAQVSGTSFIQLRDFMQPTNQLGTIGALVVSGNLISRNPRRNGVISGITKAE